jgi:hypothetical protein
MAPAARVIQPDASRLARGLDGSRSVEAGLCEVLNKYRRPLCRRTCGRARRNAGSTLRLWGRYVFLRGFQKKATSRSTAGHYTGGCAWLWGGRSRPVAIISAESE